MELQLTSLDFCRTRRSVLIWHVCVDQETPRSLRYFPEIALYRTGHSQLGGRCLQLCTGLADSPVDLEQLFELLLQSAVTDGRTSSLQQVLFGKEFHEPLIGVVWLASVQQLSFGDKLASSSSSSESCDLPPYRSCHSDSAPTNP